MSISVSNALSALPKPQAKFRTRPETDAAPISEEAAAETEAATVELSDAAKAYDSSKDALLSELTRRYESLRNGSVTISGSFLQDCLSDEGKLATLHDMLQKADAAAKDAEEGPDGHQGTETAVDADGKAETSSGKVGINAGKLARMLAAAKTKAQVQAVIAKIQQDLKECEAGKAQGMDVDEASVRAARSLLSQAQQRKGEAAGREATPEEEMAFALAGLM